MLPPHHFEYEFHPVGQGLFASGAIHDQTGHSRFRWIYDCGTTSSQTLVTNAINDYEARIGGRQRLGLVTISHFDEDHISGISELLQKFPVENLMLPYMPLWQRLLIAFEEAFPSDSPAMAFAIDPVSYVTGLPSAEIARILLVPPAGGGEAQAPPGEIGPPPTGGDGNWPLDYPKAPAPPDDEEFAPRQQSSTQIHHLAAGAVIRVVGLWEFLPYNDEAPETVTEAFRNAVEARRGRLLRAITEADRKKELEELKAEYDFHFGDNSQQRNVISLSLYGGPIYSSWAETRLAHPYKFYCPACDDLFFHGRRRPTDPESRGKCSILYTGDAYLDTPANLDRFVNYITAARAGRTGVFQVMHHGAQGNWHDSVADRIQPVFSVFSSNPDHKGLKHPHAQVLRDFWNYQPVQVDQNYGAFVGGWLLPR
jgi:hypothetical protein